MGYDLLMMPYHFERGKQHMKSFIVSIIVLFMFILAFTFGAQNQNVVTINYFINQSDFKVSFVLSMAFLFGFFLSWLFAFFYIVKLKIQLTYAQSKIKKHTEKKTLMTAQPLTT